MKLNNKGFAITTVLYGLLILFVVLVSSYLLVLSVKKDRVEDLVNEIENSYVGTMRRLNNHINTLYNNAEKVLVTDNGKEYNYALSVNLMNDKKVGTSDYDSGNIRYYGTNPNNYIYFNCTDYKSQSSSTCELWRIIGSFDGVTKIIKEDETNKFPWDEVNVSIDEFQVNTLNSSTYINNNGDGTLNSPYQIVNR